MVRLPSQGGVVLGVLDGMGGHGGGDVASRIAIRALRRVWRRPIPEVPRERYEWLLSSLYEADEAIRKEASRRLGFGAMGATAAVALVTPTQCLFLHAGDCRVYHFRRGVCEYVTADHSVVRILLETGMIKEEEMATHPMRSTVTSCLGGGSQARLSVDPKWQEDGGAAFRQLEPGDTILLCSDGLWSEVALAQLSQMVQESRGRPKRLVRACVDAALQVGASDNVTVAAACVVRKKTEPV